MTETESTNNSQEENTKIVKKLTRREAEKEEKLQKKLRYLQFYNSYPVEAPAAEWKCSACSQVQVTKKRVFSNCGHEVCKHMQPHQKKTVFEKVLEWRCEDSETHREEWDKQAWGED